jgi:hypothetical protein
VLGFAVVAASPVEPAEPMQGRGQIRPRSEGLQDRDTRQAGLLGFVVSSLLHQGDYQL